MRREACVAALLLSVWVGAVPVHGGLVSRSYEFRAAVPLEVGERTPEGVRVDRVRFVVPDGGGIVRAEVRLSNTTATARRAGVAIALFDGEARLVGAANAGTSLLPLKPGRQRTFELVFDHVSRAAATARTFQLSVECY